LLVELADFLQLGEHLDLYVVGVSEGLLESTSNLKPPIETCITFFDVLSTDD
jgi:hypothetical protein